eukprot:6119650-Amphidinium_carterae.1
MRSCSVVRIWNQSERRQPDCTPNEGHTSTFSPGDAFVEVLVVHITWLSFDESGAKLKRESKDFAGMTRRYHYLPCGVAPVINDCETGVELYAVQENNSLQQASVGGQSPSGCTLVHGCGGGSVCVSG